MISRIDKTVNGTVKINTTNAFSKYTVKKGIYGVLYTDQHIEIYSEKKGVVDKKNVVKGKGILEFSFKDATSLYIKGTKANVSLYTLPVPYYTSSPKGTASLSIPSEYAVKTTEGKYNAFVLCKTPNLYIGDVWFQYQPEDQDYIKWQPTLIAPLAPQYMQFTGLYSKEWSDKGSFLSNQPILLQCSAPTQQSYNKLTIPVREMKKAIDDPNFEFWTVSDSIFTNSEYLSQTKDILLKSLNYANSTFRPDSMKINKIMICAIDKKMMDSCNLISAGNALSQYSAASKAFANVLVIDNEMFNNKEDLTKAISHETAHIVEKNLFGSGPYTYFGWFQEGFAQYFENQIMTSLGFNKSMPTPLNTDNYKYVADMEKYLYMKTPDRFKIAEEENSWSNAMIGGNYDGSHYDFGSYFFTYLTEEYGANALKKYFSTFGLSIKQKVEASNDAFYYENLWQTVEPDCWYKLRDAASANLFKDFKAWYDKNSQPIQ